MTPTPIAVYSGSRMLARCSGELKRASATAEQDGPSPTFSPRTPQAWGTSAASPGLSSGMPTLSTDTDQSSAISTRVGSEMSAGSPNTDRCWLTAACRQASSGEAAKPGKGRATNASVTTPAVVAASTARPPDTIRSPFGSLAAFSTLKSHNVAFPGRPRFALIEGTSGGSRPSTGENFTTIRGRPAAELARPQRLDLDHERAPRGGDLDLLADLLAHQRPAERGRGGDRADARQFLLGGRGQQVLLGVGLALLEDRHHHSGGDEVGGCRHLLDDRLLDHVLQMADPGLHHRLLVPGGVVVGVLTDVAELPGPLEALAHGRPTVAGQLLELLLPTLEGFRTDNHSLTWLAHPHVLTREVHRGWRRPFGGQDRPTPARWRTPFAAVPPPEGPIA